MADVGLWKDGRTPKELCTARRTNGDPCKRPPIAGTNVCRFHGGAAPQVKRKAKQRLEEAADRMAKRLLRMTDDPEMPPAVKLAAIKDALDRAGLSPKQAHEVELSLKPYEAMFSRLERRSHDRIQNPDDDSTPHLGDDNEDGGEGRYAEWADVIDAEIVDDPPQCGGCGRQFPAELPEHLTEYPERCGDCRGFAVATREELADLVPPQGAERSNPHLGEGVPVTGYVTAEEGVAYAADADRKAGTLGPRRRPRAQRRVAPGEYEGAP